MLWHPYTPVPALGPASTLFVRAEGAHVYDDKGKKYLDGTGSWWCQVHGHCHPRLVAALTKQASQLDQILFSPHTHPVAIDLSEALLKKLGSPFTRLFFSDDGSTAVEVALKMAIQYWVNRGQPKRTRFLSLGRGYHGDTLGTVAVGDVGVFQGAFAGSHAGSVKAPEPYCYRCPLGKEYPTCEVACAMELERLLDRHADECAAVIVEPLVMGAGGMIVYPTEYLEKITRAARERGILVIYDEVFTGFGRTGTFFAFEQVTTRPDLVCLSKGLTSGMLPLAVTAATEAIYDTFAGGGEKTFYHGHTFTANALGCAVALESLKIFDDEKVIERNRELSALMAAQRERFAALPRVGDVRHRGMIWAIELVADKRTRALPEPLNGWGWEIATHLFEQGIWVRPLHNTLYFVPPYCVTPSELKRAFDVLYSAL